MIAIIFPSKTQKIAHCPVGKVPFAFVKNVVQIAFCMIAVPPVANISGNFFQVPFHSKSAPRNRRPPPNLLMLPMPLQVTLIFRTFVTFA
jgi:hypothetical protein